MLTNRKGFTLLELLISMSILVLLITLTSVGAAGFRKRAQIVKAKSQIAQMEVALEAYRNDFLKYPTDGTPATYENSNFYILEQLTGKAHDTGAFDTGITGNAKWNGPYLDPKPEDVKVISLNRTWVDPWGNAFNLRLASDQVLDIDPPKNRRLSFDVWSNGPDGTNNSGADGESGLTGDDIGNF